MTFFGSTEWYQRIAEGLVPGYSLVHKYGRNDSVGTSYEPIIDGSLAGALWQPTAPSTVRVKSGGDAGDAAGEAGARTIRVYGLDENYAFADETITLAGASASANTTTQFIRIHRAYAVDLGTYGGKNIADIMVETSSGSDDIIAIAAGEGQSQHSFFSVADGYDVWLLSLKMTADMNQEFSTKVYSFVNIDQVAAPFGATKLKLQFDGLQQPIDLKPVAPIKLNGADSPSPMDVWIESKVTTGSGEITADFELLIKKT